MAKKTKKLRTPSPIATHQIRLPKGVLSRVHIGHSFAEYDKALNKAGIFVETSAIRAALDASRPKCFFVGRRGTGKTAITYYLTQKYEKTAIQLLPQIFAPLGRFFNIDDLRDTRQRHFKSLVSSFKRALQDEAIKNWADLGVYSFKKNSPAITRERNYIEDYDFDTRLVTFVEEIFNELNQSNDKEWLRNINRTKDIGHEMDRAGVSAGWIINLLIDRIDESWDGSDHAVVLLMALMHACVELTANVESVRPLLFLRENIFERVRAIDNEFARLETFVVSLDWPEELLLELIERRLNLPLTSKLPLRGPTWDAFFEKWEEQSSSRFVFDYCQHRPRDVLTYCSFAIESAQSRKNDVISVEDLQSAKLRFSESRLKDLGDEYAENYPQIQLVLARFFGLGLEFTVNGVTAFIQKLLVDEEIKEYCSSWIYKYTQPDLFIHLFYNIGFFGIRDADIAQYRSHAPMAPTPPSINLHSSVVIHPSYADALNLQNIVVGALDEAVPLQKAGLVVELPDAIKLSEYQDQLATLKEDLKTLPPGDENAGRYEEVAGQVIRLCFFRSLTNVEPKVRDVEGRVIRDWIASNTATSGFWEMVRHRYAATQIVWECKNYSDLAAGDFHQAAYYMTEAIGRFVVLSFRGAVKKHHYEHVKRIAAEKNGGIVLLLTDRDLEVFIRQAINGKSREQHIRESYDRTVREIS